MSLLERMKKQQASLSKPITQILSVSKQKVPKKYKRPQTVPRTKAHLESREIGESTMRETLKGVIKKDSNLKDEAEKHYIEKKSAIEPDEEVLAQQWLDLGNEGQRLFIMQMLNDKAKSAEEKYFFAKLSQLPVGMQNEFINEYIEQRERYSTYFELWTSRTDVKRKIKKLERDETVEPGALPRAEEIRRDIIERAKKYAEENGIELPERGEHERGLSYEEIVTIIEPNDDKKRAKIHVKILKPYLLIANELGLKSRELALKSTIGELAHRIAQKELHNRLEAERKKIAEEEAKVEKKQGRPTTISTHKKLEIGQLEGKEEEYEKLQQIREAEIAPKVFVDEKAHFYPSHKALDEDAERRQKIKQLAKLEKRKIGYYSAFSDLQLNYALQTAQSKQRKATKSTIAKVLQKKVDSASLSVATSFLSSALLDIAPSAKEYEKESSFITEVINSLWPEEHKEMTNRQLFEKIAQFLAYLHMQQAKTLRARLSEKYYLPEILLHLSPRELLPEVYETRLSNDTVEKFSNYLLELAKFYTHELAEALIRYKDPTKRASLKRESAPSEPVIQYDLNTCVNKDELGDLAPENMAFYRDPNDNNTYCFATTVLADRFNNHDYTNPYTGRPFDKKFIRTYVVSYYDNTTGKVFRFPQSELYSMFKKGKYKHPQLSHPFESDFIQKVLSGSPFVQSKEYISGTFSSKLDARLSQCENSEEIIDEPPQNVIIYKDPEDNRKYCFAIDKLAESISEQTPAFAQPFSTRIINARTGRYFSEKFIREFLKKYGLYRRVEKREEEKKVKEEEEKKVPFLIPNLYDIVAGNIELLLQPHREKQVEEKSARYIIGDTLKIPHDNREYTVIDIEWENDEPNYTIRYEKDAMIIPRKQYKLMVASFENDDPYVINEEEVEIRDGKYYLGKKEILSSSDKNYTPGTIVIKIKESELQNEDDENEDEKLPDYKKVKSMLEELAEKESKSKAKMGFATETKSGTKTSTSSKSSSSSESQSESEETEKTEKSTKEGQEHEENVEKNEQPVVQTSSVEKVTCAKCGKDCGQEIKSIILEESGPKTVIFCCLKCMEKFSFPSAKRSRRRGRKRRNKTN